MEDFFGSDFSKKVPNEFIQKFPGNVELWLKREDLLHPRISGNKFRKLKYNLSEARKKSLSKLLTFGGAHSNHIAAVAAAGKKFDFKTIGIIRGEELAENPQKWSPSLRYASESGMKLEFISREEYRVKDSVAYREKLKQGFGDFYLIPEGGTNEFAIRGCAEILTKTDSEFDYICTSVGTGGTMAGILHASEEHQQILGFSALKSDYLLDEIQKMTGKTNWELILNYHFGGYAKVSADLIDFINNFYRMYQIALDPVYTGKMLFGIFELATQQFFPENSRILAIHTGGIQGIEGMNEFLRKKNWPQIIGV